MKFKRSSGIWSICSVALLILIVVCSVIFSEGGMSKIEKAIFYSIVGVFVIFEIYTIWKFVRANQIFEEKKNENSNHLR